MTDWSYDAWPSGEPYDWMGGRHDRPDDQLDFHVDIGCGKVKKGRIGVDRHPAPGVNVLADLDSRPHQLRGNVANAVPVTWAIATEPGADAIAPWANEWEERLVSLGLPFEDNSIESIISSHCFEHVGEGFLPLVDELYRVLKPGAPLRAITPLFPSISAVEDPDHRRYFLEGTFDVFCGFPDNHWCESFSVPYTRARFECTDRDISPLAAPEVRWTAADRREMRTTLRPRK